MRVFAFVACCDDVFNCEVFEQRRLGMVCGSVDVNGVCERLLGKVALQESRAVFYLIEAVVCSCLGGSVYWP